MTMRVLVAGGAGYIGSVTTAALVSDGHRVVVLDNLSHGHARAVHHDARLVTGDIADARSVRKACEDGIDVAMHFAAFIEVGESVSDPARYYGNNAAASIRFLEHLKDCGVTRIVFSSSAAVYGEPERVPIDEDSPPNPVNPYGRTKRIVEQVLEDYDRAYGIRSLALRYFNAGGSYLSLGEDHHPESHLIPRVIDSAIRGEAVRVYGDRYPTRDGTCVRDYIHVRDLADAHIRAARHLCGGGGSDVCNLGSGRGSTVLEVIEAAERVTGRRIERMIAEKRPGDPPELIASHERAGRLLGWGDELADIDEIVESAYAWRKEHPGGYGDIHT
jgi:UDP-glucose 4-epimerase